MSPASETPLYEPILAGLEAMRIAPPPQSVASLARYLGMVSEWNRAYNLTAIRDPADMVHRHVLDSAAALPFLRGERMLDAGSGAGLPGLVLALLAPDTRWVLAESTGKKARFLERTVRELGLSDRVSVHAGRVEACRPDAGFDTVTARALADLAQLVRWTAPGLAPGGRLVALKGRPVAVQAELAALPAGWRSQVNPVTLPEREAERCIVILERGD